MRELELEQPTLSKRLKYLQHAGPLLDRPWLVREGKTWKLTDEGRKVWPAVEELVDRYQNLHTFVEEGGKPAGAAPVHFACGQAMAAGLVRHALLEFREKHPDARLRISTLRGRRELKASPTARSTWRSSRMTSRSILEIARRSLHIEPLVDLPAGTGLCFRDEVGIEAAVDSQSRRHARSVLFLPPDPPRARRRHPQGAG